LSDSEEKKEVPVKVFLLNKKERYEYGVKETGKDSRKDIVKDLIKKIVESEDDMYERRKNIQGFDIIMADGKVPALLKEAIDSYTLGNFFSTIALCGMTAERLCYDFIDFVDIKIGEKLLNDEQKQVLNRLPFNSMVEFFWKIGSFNDRTKNLMFDIAAIRNRHIHPTMVGPAEDAIKILNLLCKVLEEKLSIFQFYDIKDGRLVLKR
jgi:hypothetical protein